MARIIKPSVINYSQDKSIFLGGSIEMGKASNWQREIEINLKEYKINILNPRNDTWDSTIKCSSSDPKFKDQVIWELTGIEKSDLIIFYFDPTTTSPITLMELGLCAALKPQQTIVCCPEGYFRKGNVDILCEKFKMLQVKNLDDLTLKIIQKIIIKGFL